MTPVPHFTVFRFTAGDDFSGEELVYAKDYDRLQAQLEQDRNDADRFRFLVKFNEDQAMNDAMDDIMDEWFNGVGGSEFVEESSEHWIEFIDKARSVAVELGLWPALEGEAE